MDATLIGIIGIVSFLGLLALGVPVAVSMLAVGLFGSISIVGLEGGLSLLASTPYAATDTYEYITIPLFLLVGSLALYGGFAQAAYEAAYKWSHKLPGGLAIATTLACGAFGAVSGSSVATAATFGRVSIPEMVKYKYDMKFTLGCVASAGTFAMLIPPSIIIIVYGFFTDTSIAKLFMAGIIPGLCTIIAYVLLIIYRVKRHPEIAPIIAENTFTMRERLYSSLKAWPIAVIAVLVLGGIYLGWFTATESAAAAALAALLIAAKQKGIKGANLPVALRETAYDSAMIFIILVGSILFSRFLALSQIPNEIASFIGNLSVSPLLILVGFLAMYFGLGMIINALAMLVITLPLVTPVLSSLGYDLVWFGIIAIKMCEIAVITPPIGLNVYVVKGVVGEQATLKDVFSGIWPFVVCDLAVLALLVAFPQIVLFLPNLMN